MGSLYSSTMGNAAFPIFFLSPLNWLILRCTSSGRRHFIINKLMPFKDPTRDLVKIYVCVTISRRSHGGEKEVGAEATSTRYLMTPCHAGSAITQIIANTAL